MADTINRLILIMLIGAVFVSGIAYGKVEVGPYVQFTGPYTAVVRWDTDTASNSVVQYGKTTSLGSSVSDATSTTIHEVTIDNIEWNTKSYYRVNDGQGGYSDTYWFDNRINYTRLDCSGIASPYAPDSLTAAYEAAADRIITRTGIKKGYCLVYGCGEGRLAFELAKRSDLIIIGVDTDIEKINTAAKKLMSAGVYGSRVTTRHVSSLSSLDFTKCFFNLIVSDRMISDGACVGSAAEIYRILRPVGGTAYFGQPASSTNVLTQNELETWLGAGSLTFTTANDGNGIWSKVMRGALAGTGWWSHQYGTEAGSSNSFDTMAGATAASDMNLQWTGRPGSDIALDRHSKMPAPVAAGGRLYHQGYNRILGMDSYNGSIYWSLEIPHLRRVNLPRDASNACADDDAVYVAVKDACWRLDGDTGIRTHTYKTGDSNYDFGFAFRYGDKLYGGSSVKGSAYKYTNSVNKPCSDNIFAFDKDDDSARLWTYEDEDGIIIHSTICIGDGRIYFVESRNPALKGRPSGEADTDNSTENALWNGGVYLVALDADTGAKLWEKDLKAGDNPPIATGDVVRVIYLMFVESGNDDLLVLETSEDVTFYLNTYEVDDTTCTFRWTANHAAGNGKHNMKHAVIIGDEVYLYPNAYRLSNGSVLRNDLPRAECGADSAIGTMLCGRYSTDDGVTSPQNLFFDLGLWDSTSTPGTSDTIAMTGWAPIRPSCWLNITSGGNMLFMLEGGGGCACQMYFATTVGFIPTGN